MNTPPLLSTGDWGLDLALGGGVRMVPRPDSRAPSATILIRGAPGAGKTVLALQTAVEMAAQRGGDVAYGLVELAPGELIAQRGWLWGDVGKPRSRTRMARIEQPPFGRRTGEGVHVYASVLEVDPNPKRVLDAFGRSLDELLAVSREVEARPVVLVVDSLSTGYGLSTAPREFIDAVVKLAWREGVVLLLLEEGFPGEQSEWAYAADIVIELDHLDRTDTGAQLERKLWVVKNRYAPSVHGPHRFSILTDEGVRVFPAPVTYATPWARQSVQLPPPVELPSRSFESPARSWCLGPETTQQMEKESLDWPMFSDRSLFVSGPDAEVVRAMARTVGATECDGADLWVDFGSVHLDLRRLPSARSGDWIVGLGMPMLSSQRLIYAVLDALRGWAESESDFMVRRIVIGDLAALRSYVSPDELTRALVVLLGVLRRAELAVVMFQTAPATVLADIVGELDLYATGETLPPLAEHADAVLEILPVQKSGVPVSDYAVQLWERLTGKRVLQRESRAALIQRGRAAR